MANVSAAERMKTGQPESGNSPAGECNWQVNRQTAALDFVRHSQSMGHRCEENGERQKNVPEISRIFLAGQNMKRNGIHATTAAWRQPNGVEVLPIRAKSSLNPPSPLRGESDGLRLSQGVR
jgi:hypothetical protein